MYKALIIGELIALLVAIGLSLYVVYLLLKKGEVKLKHQATKRALSNQGIYDRVDETPKEPAPANPAGELEAIPEEPAAAKQMRLDLLGIGDTGAGLVITVPNLKPSAESGWDAQETILGTFTTVVYTYQGTDPADVIEMTGGKLLFCTGKGVALLQHSKLVGDEVGLLMAERDSFTTTFGTANEDSVIENFRGKRWNIRGAYGDNIYRKELGRENELRCSFMQAVSVTGEIKKADVLKSLLPTGLFDRKAHDYYDVRAICPDTGEYLIAFYVAGEWSLWIGRILEEAELYKLKERKF